MGIRKDISLLLITCMVMKTGKDDNEIVSVITARYCLVFNLSLRTMSRHLESQSVASLHIGLKNNPMTNLIRSIST